MAIVEEMLTAAGGWLAGKYSGTLDTHTMGMEPTAVVGYVEGEIEQLVNELIIKRIYARKILDACIPLISLVFPIAPFPTG